MNIVNLDLLNTLPHGRDGRPKDPHAHHAAELRHALRMERRAKFRKAVAAILSTLLHGKRPEADGAPLRPVAPQDARVA